MLPHGGRIVNFKILLQSSAWTDYTLILPGKFFRLRIYCQGKQLRRLTFFIDFDLSIECLFSTFSGDIVYSNVL